MSKQTMIQQATVVEDIVTQLRWIGDHKQWVKLRDWTTITTEAADEIERLRAEVEHYKTLYYKQATEATHEP